MEINSVSSMLLSPVVDCTPEVPEEAINLSSERTEAGKKGGGWNWASVDSSSCRWRDTEQRHPQVRKVGILLLLLGACARHPRIPALAAAFHSNLFSNSRFGLGLGQSLVSLVKEEISFPFVSANVP